MRIVLWGTYDAGTSRNRILSRGLRENGVEVIECHKDVWRGIEDKSRIAGLWPKLRLLIKWLCSYPSLIWQYLRLPRHDVVIVGYLGHLDVLLLWPFAKLRRTPILWDVYISLYNTVVEDRKLVGPRHPLAYLLFLWEWLACRAANVVVLDTRTHADFFVQKFNIHPSRTAVVFLGVEPELFPVPPGFTFDKDPAQPITVLFYGNFIPLHGIDTIVQAAILAENEPIDWILLGRGQEESKIRSMIEKHPLPRLTWLPWVRYDEVAHLDTHTDVGLGIFSSTEKAGRGIPNKIFQMISAGKPIITRDSPAIRELLSPDMPGIFLVPPSDPSSIVQSIKEIAKQRHTWPASGLHQNIRNRIQPRAIGSELLEILRNLNPEPHDTQAEDSS